MDFDRTATRLSGYFGGQLLVKALYLTGIVAATRAAGPEGWGLLTAALSIGLIGVTVVDLGLKPYLTREVAAKRIPLKLLTRSAVKYRLASSTAFTLLAPLLLAATVPDATFPVAVVLTAYLVVDSWCEYSFALQRGAATTRFEVAGLIVEKSVFALLAVAILALTSAERTVLLLATALAASAVAKFAVAVRGGKRTFEIPLLPLKQILRRADAGSWRREVAIIRESVVFLFMAIFTTIYFRIDSYMLAVLAGNETAGHYGAAYKLIEGLLFAPSGVVVVFGPLIVAALAAKVISGRDVASDASGTTTGPGTWSGRDAEPLITRVSALQFAIGGTLAVGLWLESGWIVRVLYGSAFEQSGPLLAWLSIAFLFMSCNFLLGTLMISLYRQQALLALTVAGALVNVGLNLLLIPMLGGFGAVLATVGVEGLVLLGMLIHISRHISIRWVLGSFPATGFLLVALMVVPGLLVRGASFAVRAPIEIGGAVLLFGVLMARGSIPNPFRRPIGKDVA